MLLWFAFLTIILVVAVFALVLWDRLQRLSAGGNGIPDLHRVGTGVRYLPVPVQRPVHPGTILFVAGSLQPSGWNSSTRWRCSPVIIRPRRSCCSAVTGVGCRGCRMAVTLRDGYQSSWSMPRSRNAAGLGVAPAA